MKAAIYARVSEYCNKWPVFGSHQLKLSRLKKGRIRVISHPNPDLQREAEEELIALVMELLHQRLEGEYEQQR